MIQIARDTDYEIYDFDEFFLFWKTEIHLT